MSREVTIHFVCDRCNTEQSDQSDLKHLQVQQNKTRYEAELCTECYETVNAALVEGYEKIGMTKVASAPERKKRSRSASTSTSDPSKTLICACGRAFSGMQNIKRHITVSAKNGETGHKLTNEPELAAAQ